MIQGERRTTCFRPASYRQPRSVPIGGKDRRNDQSPGCGRAPACQVEKFARTFDLLITSNISPYLLIAVTTQK